MAVERKVIHNTTGLGSFYDQHKDQIIRTFNKQISKIKNFISVNCKSIYGESVKNNNLLELIGINNDSRLNILLGLIPKTRLTSIIDYPLPVNQYTRLLHYTQICRRQYLKNYQMCKKPNQLIKAPVNATHLITSVTWGIEFIVVLQLPPVEETAEEIDIVLDKICSNLNVKHRQYKPLSLNENDENILRQISNTTVYSDNPRLRNMRTIDGIYQSICTLRKDKIYYRPITFILHPIDQIDLKDDSSNNLFHTLDNANEKDMEKYLLQALQSINYVKSFLSRLISLPIYEHLKEQYGVVSTRCSNVENHYEKEIKQWKKIIPNWRRNKMFVSALFDEQSQRLKRKVDDLLDHLKCLQTKEELINDLQQNHFGYCNVSKEDVYSIDDVRKIVKKLIQDYQYDQVLCSSDYLNTNKIDEFHRKRNQIVKKYRRNSNLHLLYADFSSCTFELPNIIIFTKDNIENNNHKNTTSNTTSTDEFVNILLLGESGVGKSTFINAFINYLTFDSLSEAESNKPVVLIPVSFIITTGDNFDEHIVRFGDLNENSNEDFDHPGQSVTQHCQSYEFNLRNQHRKKLRIIDTPGFGDTRGLDQDDFNMQHIIQYLNQFSHINAICFLLKPNATRLTNSLRLCLLQLHQLINPNIQINILFCFTNARTTFYTLGDTAPLLRTMFKTLPSNDIPFKKENTFCFDNEAFRYLVSLQNGIRFNELDRYEYEKSWSISVNESNRMIKYICQDLRICSLDNRQESLRKTQIEIVSMVHPMLEAIKNIVQLMSFSSTVIDQSKSIDNTFEHTISSNLSKSIIKQIKHCKPRLFNASIEFAQFLINTNYSTKMNEPFRKYLTQMINQETVISLDNNYESHRRELLKILKEYKKKYKQEMKDFQANPDNIDLSALNQRIKMIQDVLIKQKQIMITKKDTDITESNAQKNALLKIIYSK